MKYSYTLFFLCLLVPFVAAAQELPANSSVVILLTDGQVPANAKSKGTLRIKDGGFKTNCGYSQTFDEARRKAQAAGANIIKITQIKPPDGWSSCYRMNMDLYHLEELAPLIAEQQAAEDSAMRTLLPDTASYALLCVYRPKSGSGALVQYNVHVNDSMVCRVKNGGSYLVKIYHPDQARVWARTEKREEVVLNFQAGKAYFLRCSVGMGAFVGRPVFDVIDAAMGIREFNGTKAEKVVDSTEDPVYSVAGKQF
ncbi:DUF2846 domain-containing protein [Chitinophaga deserti]|uniref:DUF2846 domain-containing protein n=1 Tax=Chitinophaga deserti TaxID=2164099 RepID=UPI000D6C95EB|nr:DUF2846 domain-containing protein [Chitinophaga deserti]